MTTSVALSTGPIHLGLDTSKNSVAVGVLRPGKVSPDTEKIFNDEASMRRLIDRFPDRSVLRGCYEAGPTGFGLYRLLASMGWPARWWRRRWCPARPGIGSRPIGGTAAGRLHRAGELTAIRVPTPEEGAVRDLRRARADMVRTGPAPGTGWSKFLLRHDRIWRAAH